MRLFPLHNDQDPACPHCVLADGINQWRQLPGCQEFIGNWRKEGGELAAPYDDDTLAAAGMISAMGSLVGELLTLMEPKAALYFGIAYADAVKRGVELGKAARALDDIAKGKHS